MVLHEEEFVLVSRLQGFYRACRKKSRYHVTTSSIDLQIGPYQGTHGCLRIPAGQGVCGQALQERQTVVADQSPAL